MSGVAIADFYQGDGTQGRATERLRTTDRTTHGIATIMVRLGSVVHRFISTDERPQGCGRTEI